MLAPVNEFSGKIDNSTRLCLGSSNKSPNLWLDDSVDGSEAGVFCSTVIKDSDQGLGQVCFPLFSVGHGLGLSKLYPFQTAPGQGGGQPFSWWSNWDRHWSTVKLAGQGPKRPNISSAVISATGLKNFAISESLRTGSNHLTEEFAAKCDRIDAVDLIFALPVAGVKTHHRGIIVHDAEGDRSVVALGTQESDAGAGFRQAKVARRAAAVLPVPNDGAEFRTDAASVELFGGGGGDRGHGHSPFGGSLLGPIQVLSAN